MNDNKKTTIEPVRDAIRLALHGKKIGRIEPDEIEEENIHEQRKLSKNKILSDTSSLLPVLWIRYF